MPQFILASGSPRRQSLLRGLEIAFIVEKPDIDETPSAQETPEDYVARLSQEKAHYVAPGKTGETYILAADTTVIHDGEIIGKPADEDEARRMLLRLRGDEHRVCTGFTVLRLSAGVVADTRTEVVCTTVRVRFFAASDMERWIASGAAFDKAGGYAIQSKVFNPVDEIDGSYNNVVGLPTERLSDILREMGYPLAGPDPDRNEDEA
jgi:septum formation protein